MPSLKVSSIRYLVSGIKNTKYIILNTRYCKPRGFTLIELLIVIALIGILASFGVVAFNKFQQMGRDARRKSDLDAIKTALELAKQDSTGGTYYPQCPGYGSNCVLDSTNQTNNPQISPTYIKTVPTDPKAGNSCINTTAYCYVPSPTPCEGATPLGPPIGPCTGYELRVCLENGNDNGNNVTTVGVAACASTKRYSIFNP